MSIYPGLRREWMADAACTEPEDAAKFDVETSNNRGAGRRAKAVCRRCPVIKECLAYALAWPTSAGIWGGTDEYDRSKLHGRGL